LQQYNTNIYILCTTVKGAFLCYTLIKCPVELSNSCASNAVQVDYEVLPGWKSDISSIRKYADLPKAAQQYVERIEELVGVPIHYIGIGPGRDALIYK